MYILKEILQAIHEKIPNFYYSKLILEEKECEIYTQKKHICCIERQMYGFCL